MASLSLENSFNQGRAFFSDGGLTSRLHRDRQRPTWVDQGADGDCQKYGLVQCFTGIPSGGTTLQVNRPSTQAGVVRVTGVYPYEGFWFDTLEF